MTNNNDIYDGLSPEARELAEELIPQIRTQVAEIERIPVAVLIWGSNPSTPTPAATKRVRLRRLFREKGHWACFSEELVDSDSKVDPRIQQICQARQFDIIVSIPDGPGSFGEIHEFARDEQIKKKIIVFLNEAFKDGYSHQSLSGSSGTGSYKVVSYKPTDLELEDSIFESTLLKNLQHIRYEKFLINRKSEYR